MSFDFSILTAFWPLFARGLFITIAASGQAFAVVSLLYWVMCTGVARIGRALENTLSRRHGHPSAAVPRGAA